MNTTTTIGCALATLFLGCSAADVREGAEKTATTSEALTAVSGFGANPGNLLMYRYVPSGMPSNAPLVVVLHGCLEGATDAASYGFDSLADANKFYVLYPQQQTANNPDTCFDWFGQYNSPANKANITRGQGEDQSIKEMVDKMKADYSVDTARVYVVGFSAGAAMAAVMMATWPDVFAAGGIAAGVPYNCPSTSNSDVFTCMNPGKVQTAQQWGAVVHAGAPSWTGAWPRASIWQGTSDTTVGTGNEAELVKQWTDVLGVSATPSATSTVDGQQRAVYTDGSGHVQVEMWKIAGMAHGFAVDPSHGCGTAGNYVYDEHICTAAHMWAFFSAGAGSSSGGSGSGASSSGASSSGGSSGGGSTSSSGSTGGGSSGSGGSTSGGAGNTSGGTGSDAGVAFDDRGAIAGCSVSAAPARSRLALPGGLLAAAAAASFRRRRARA